MASLGREEILKAIDLRREEVAVPEWNGTLYLRVMTGKERDELETRHAASNGKPADSRGFRALLVVYCAVDVNGQRLFNSADIGALQEKSSVALDRVASAAMRLNGLTDGAVDDALKNSEAVQPGDSGSG